MLVKCKKEKQETSLFKCAGCKITVYCSKECQKSSWKTGGHRSDCLQVQKSEHSAYFLYFVPSEHSSRELTRQMCIIEISELGLTFGALRFLNFVSIAELRRHMPGVSERLANDKKLSGILLKDAIIRVSFLSLPPTITVHSEETLPHELEEQWQRAQSQSIDAFYKTEDTFTTFGDRGNGLPSDFEVRALWGGLRPLSLVQPISPAIQLYCTW